MDLAAEGGHVDVAVWFVNIIRLDRAQIKCRRLPVSRATKILQHSVIDHDFVVRGYKFLLSTVSLSL